MPVPLAGRHAVAKKKEGGIEGFFDILSPFFCVRVGGYAISAVGTRGRSKLQGVVKQSATEKEHNGSIGMQEPIYCRSDGKPQGGAVGHGRCPPPG